jgi:hypothetical protein
MEQSLDQLLDALAVITALEASPFAEAVAGPIDKDVLVDAIESRIADDPAGSRAEISQYTGSEGLKIWALGQVGDPEDNDTLASARDDPNLRETAQQALALQPGAKRVGALEALAPLASDNAAPILQQLLDDPETQIPRLAARGIERLIAKNAQE